VNICGANTAMDWVLEASEYYRSQIRNGRFFEDLDQVQRVEDMTWVHQLVHQSREFTQALCLRSALCADRTFQRIFSSHAVEEADHPNQLVQWMRGQGFLDDIEAGEVPATPATVECLSYCWRAAFYESREGQVVILNVLSEGVALDFYAAVIPVLERLGALSGRYWTVHREVDAHHLRLGLDECQPVSPDSDAGRRLQGKLQHAAGLYNRMLSSWVGVQAKPLTPWSYELSRAVSDGARKLAAA